MNNCHECWFSYLYNDDGGFMFNIDWCFANMIVISIEIPRKRITKMYFDKHSLKMLKFYDFMTSVAKDDDIFCDMSQWVYK